MVRMYKGSVAGLKKSIVQSIKDMYEQGKLLTYFDIQDNKFKVLYRNTDENVKRSDYDNVTELDLVDVYGIKGLYDRIKELDEYGEYHSEVTYQDLAYMFDKEVEKKVFNVVMSELNTLIEEKRGNNIHYPDSLQSYANMLDDILYSIRTLYNKYC